MKITKTNELNLFTEKTRLININQLAFYSAISPRLG